MTGVDSTRLYGREREQAAITRLLADARAGHSRVLVIRGESGIGKTALLEYAAQQAPDMRLLRCGGIESEIELAFAGLHQLVWPLADRLDALTAAQAAALRGAVGLDATGGDRFLVATALLTLLAEAAEERPLLVVIDDAQWLDSSSADVLFFAARRLEAEPIAVLVSAREGAGEEFRSDGLPALEITGIGPADAEALLNTVPGHLAPHVRERLLAESNGNPLALLELSSSLSPAEREGHDALPAQLALTPRLQRVFHSRLRLLPEATRQLLVIAAAEESGDMSIVLAAASRLGLDISALAPAEEQGLLSVADHRVRFRHPLVRSAVYQGATFSDRVTAHRAIADVLDGTARQDRRAWHLAAAAIGYDEQAALALEQTADRARQRNGPGAAAAALERAASLSRHGTDRARRLILGARAALDAGQWSRTRYLLAEADAAEADPVLRADAASIRGVLQYETVNLDTACRTLADGADAIRDHDADRAAALLTVAARMCWLEADQPRLALIRDRVLGLPGEPVGLNRRLALSMLGSELRTGATELDGFGGAAAQSLRVHGPDPWLWPPAIQAALVGEDTMARRLYTTAVQNLRESGAIGHLAQALAGLGYSESYLGLWGDAQVHASEGLRLSRETGQPGGVALCLALLARIAGAQGRADDCYALASEAREHAVAQGTLGAVEVTRWALGLLALGSGQHEEAFAQLAEIADPAAWPDRSLFAPIAVLDLIEAAILTGRTELAEHVLGEFTGWAQPRPTPWSRLVIHRSRALLSTGPEAERGFQEALAVPGAQLRRFPFARTQLLYGEWLRRNRRRRDARTQLRPALSTLAGMGATRWADRARTELRASGETVNSRAHTAFDALTPQELQITRLAARGLSNREIGAQLFLSPRTVGFHLYNAFPKLGVASRSGLRELQLEEITDASLTPTGQSRIHAMRRTISRRKLDTGLHAGDLAQNRWATRLSRHSKSVQGGVWRWHSALGSLSMA
jgi:DNA-binding CsgD family transcriptional regulator